MSHLSPELRTSSGAVVLILKLTLADNGGVETVSVMSLCPCESPPVWVSAGSLQLSIPCVEETAPVPL